MHAPPTPSPPKVAKKMKMNEKFWKRSELQNKSFENFFQLHQKKVINMKNYKMEKNDSFQNHLRGIQTEIIVIWKIVGFTKKVDRKMSFFSLEIFRNVAIMQNQSKTISSISSPYDAHRCTLLHSFHAKFLNQT